MRQGRSARRHSLPAELPRAALSGAAAELPQYATIERLRGVLSVVEACAADLPALEAMYFGRGRPARIDLLGEYLRRRATSGHLRSFPDTAVAAQIVTETVAWFGWKRLEGRDASRFDDNMARRTVVVRLQRARSAPGGTVSRGHPAHWSAARP